MTEREKGLIEYFIKRAEQGGRVVMEAEVIGAVIAMIYDIWKYLYVR